MKGTVNMQDYIYICPGCSMRYGGPGKIAEIKRCSTCHEKEKAFYAQRSRNEVERKRLRAEEKKLEVEEMKRARTDRLRAMAHRN
jgi:hypothetical protein